MYLNDYIKDNNYVCDTVNGLNIRANKDFLHFMTVS